MRLLSFFAACLLSVLPAALHAQAVSIYGTFSPTRVSNVEDGLINMGDIDQPQYTSFWAAGFGGGVTFNFLPIGPVRLGFDLRGSTRPGTNGVDTALFGLKAGVKLPTIPLKPYIQGSGGYVSARATNVSGYGGANRVGGTFSTQYAAYEILGGVDYSVAPFIDLRLIEVGGGKGYDENGYNTGQVLGLFTLNSGVVFHF